MSETPSFSANVSRETNEKLSEFVDLVLKWTKSINLIAPSSIPNIWERHISDSRQVYSAAGETWESWVDLGSGGGFPGIVVAILDPKSRPVALIESDKRKSAFLNAAKRELNLNVRVLSERIESVKIEPSDIISARALAPLDQLLMHASRLVKTDGTALFLKGREYQKELDYAENSWRFECDSIQSVTSEEARLLKISRISHRER